MWPSEERARTASGRGGGIRSQLGLATLLVVLFLTFLDNTVISVTLAAVQSSLHAGVSQLQWVIDAYALVFAPSCSGRTCLPPAGCRA